jgi:alkanesulfonate monooxygenase SsuD/methylene tetrahydromethanopterin reductase-like flavin-dependent oxidoreductase (luciferase family)
MLPIGVVLASFGARYAELREAAQELDQLGFNSVWLWDHYVSWNDPRESVLECWTTLAGLAEATRRIRLGPLVANNTNRHPGRLAKVAATLNELSGGRLELGIGAGGWAAEQAPFGIDQGDRAERTARLAEALQIVRGLWIGEPLTFHGHYYQLNGAIAAPKQDPPPRIIIGGRSTELARLAGQYANGLNLQWGFRDTFPVVLAALDAALSERGRTRSGFDLSLHADWDDLMRDPEGMLSQWEAAGFARVMLAVSAPFPLGQFSQVARRFVA